MTRLRLQNAPKKGDEILFGRYTQRDALLPPSPDGLRHFRKDVPKDPLSWIVLDVDEEKQAALLLSKYVIDVKPYDDGEGLSSWAQCSLRAWLNVHFFMVAFTKRESDCILTTHLENPANAFSGAPGGQATDDKVFLLSLADLWHKDPKVPNSGKYFTSDARQPNDERKAFATPYAMCVDDIDETPQWWLRSPGGGSESDEEEGLCCDAVGVEEDGTVDTDGYYVISESTGVRPALWIHYSAETAGSDTAVADAAKVEALKAKLDAQRASDPGDTLAFGHYVQADGFEEPIKWILLAEDDCEGKQLFISEKILEGKPFNTAPADITWEASTLRSWLNGYDASQNKAGEDYTGDNFIDKAFTAEEKALIAETSVPAHANPDFDTAPGNETKDRIFLLSIEEVDDSFMEDAGLLNAETSDYTRKNGYEGASWWLRSPGRSPDMAARVFSASGVHRKGSNVDKVFGVRPALWIKYLK